MKSVYKYCGTHKVLYVFTVGQNEIIMTVPKETSAPDLSFHLIAQDSECKFRLFY